MKKFILVVLILLGVVWFYYWYVRGINLLLSEEDPNLTPSYTFATRLPAKDEGTKASPGWQQAAPMLSERSEVGAAALGGKIYVIGGIDGFSRTLDTVEAFDTTNNTWAKVVPLPKPLRNVTVVALDEKIYAIGGLEGIAGIAAKEVFIYDPKTNVWSDGPKLPKANGAAAAVVLDRQIHLFGGISELGTSASYLVYDLSRNAWNFSEEMLSLRDHHGAAAIDGMLYVVGGSSGSIANNIGELQRIRPGGREWEQLESMPVKRGGIGVVGYGGKLYVFGGEAPTSTFDRVDVYDPKTRAWSSSQKMPTARHGSGTAEAGGRIFVIGGGRRPGLSVSNLNEVFTP